MANTTLDHIHTNDHSLLPPKPTGVPPPETQMNKNELTLQSLTQQRLEDQELIAHLTTNKEQKAGENNELEVEHSEDQGTIETTEEQQLDKSATDLQFQVPEALYKFSAKENHEVNSTILMILNKTTDFDEATQTLIPHDEVKAQLLKIRTELQGCSAACDRNRQSLAKTDNPNYIHKSVMVKAGIEVPFGSRDFPKLQTIYDGIHISMCTLNDEYRRRGTALITQTLRVQAFQLRIEQVKLLYNQLITNVTQFHIS
jgi:hypothetical protein